MAHGAEGGVEGFERAIVFRIARGYFLVLAVLGVLALAGGAAALIASSLSSKVPEPSMPPPVPPAERITLASVEKWAAEQKTAPKAEPVYEAPKGSSQPQDPEIAELRRLEEQLKALFPSPTYTWDDQYQDYCKVPTGYGCLQRGRKLVQEGIVQAFKAVLKDADSKEEALTILRTLVEVLGQSPVEKRGSIVLPTVQALRTSNAEQRRLVAKHEAEVERLKAEHRVQQAAKDITNGALKLGGIWGAATGLALLVMVSIFLALFAIERHLRTLVGLSRQGTVRLG